MTSSATTTNHPPPQEARETLWKLIKDIRFSMFTVRHTNGHLHSRPMTTQNAGLDDRRQLVVLHVAYQ